MRENKSGKAKLSPAVSKAFGDDLTPLFRPSLRRVNYCLP